MRKDLSNVTLIGVESREKYLHLLKVASDICQENFYFGAVKLLSSVEDEDKRVVKIPDIKSTVAYSEFCIKEIWKYVDTEYALFFQYDGFILNPSAWDDNFLKYDYIGAPWYHMGKPLVGNGGFSLRSKRLLDIIAKNYEKIGGNIHPEDVWICETARKFLEKEGMKFAPIELASRFCKEGCQRGIFWDGEFGFHGLNYTDISKWLDKNSQYRNNFINKLDDFSNFMGKYPVYDGTFHVLRAKPIQVKHYKELGCGEKDYDCRMDADLIELDEVKFGHKIIYQLYRISLEKVGTPTFERKVKNVEKFTSKKDLLTKRPDIKITPSFHLPKWRQRLISVFGNIAFPKNRPYTLFCFDKVN